MTTDFLSCFSLQIYMCMLSEKLCLIDISVSEKLNCLLYLLSLEFEFSSSRLKAAIDREPWFTGTIEHRFSNSVDQSQRA